MSIPTSLHRERHAGGAIDNHASVLQQGVDERDLHHGFSLMHLLRNPDLAFVSLGFAEYSQVFVV